MIEQGQPQDQSWEACPPGLLVQSIASHRNRQQRRQFLKALAGSLSVVGVTGAALLGYREWTRLIPVPITCNQALADLHDWKTISTQERENALAHARVCPACHKKFVEQGVMV